MALFLNPWTYNKHSSEIFLEGLEREMCGKFQYLSIFFRMSSYKGYFYLKLVLHIQQGYFAPLEHVSCVDYTEQSTELQVCNETLSYIQLHHI